MSMKPTVASRFEGGSPPPVPPARGSETRAARLGLPVAIAAGVLAGAAYLVLMGETTPFWDSGEFIATSWILGIPHPPGTPLYVLLGRIATLFPFGTVAERVNGLSAVAGALAVFFTTLATIRLLRPMLATEGAGDALAVIGGGVAGLFTAFANTCWINSLEAEVYSLSNLMMAVALWAALRWRDAAERDEPGGDGRPLLLIFYVLSLSIALHLGTYLILPGIITLVALERRHAILTGQDLALWCLGLPAGLWLVLRATGGGAAAAALAAGLLAALLLLTRRRGFIVALVLLFTLGVSVHLFLLIRSRWPHLAINEAAPKDWRALWEVLTRKQYPPTNIFERRGPFLFQVDRLFLHYLREQWQLFVGPGVVGVLGRVLPLALGILGAIALTLRRPRDGAMMLVHFLIMSLALIVYLNLSATFNEATGRWEIGEVRERDYFFAPAFQIFAMWIGIGAASLLGELGRGGAEPAAAGATPGRWRRLAVPVGGAVALGLGLLPLSSGFATHDRRGNFVARDYGYNILAFLEPDAIIFTNGDNDTFPLWYLQQVEGVRKDVRVVCLSLLNTNWYIKQLRDDPPQVPITWTDPEIDSLRVAYHPRDGLVTVHLDGSYEPGTVKDAGVRHIVRANEYRRPIYFAVTVPDRVGLDRQLSFEGMVFRVLPQPPSSPMDFDRAYANAFKNYLYRGVLLPDGTRDHRVHVDDTGEYLIHNYVIHFAELAFELQSRGRQEEAIQLVTRCEAIAPDRVDFNIMRGAMLDEAGQPAAAESLFRRAIVADPGNLDANYRLGVALYRQGRLGEAKPVLAEARRLAGDRFLEPTLWLARVEWDAGNPPEARRLLAEWVRARPADERAARVLEELSRGDDRGLPAVEREPAGGASGGADTGATHGGQAPPPPP